MKRLEINRDAPVTAAAQGFIDAPRELVWDVQADLERWPAWNPDVTEVRLLVSREPEPGMEFTWKAGGVKIRSRFQDLERPRRLSWTGRTLGIRAAHVWEFKEQDGGTLVTTRESFTGILARLLSGPMRRMLESSLEKGVEALRRECERRRDERVFEHGDESA